MVMYVLGEPDYEVGVIDSIENDGELYTMLKSYNFIV